ncbi:hypothetical protein OG345_40790 (plasmid) [Streptomyces sp. NBC_01220]|uniref:hypothetical protein n=1 Tax=Streptomyces sp. NBC_01220 TaxID=2903781 RepID=UPI002F9168FD|nr:hypothetical protein OG345_40790 [Streptomyces sp. NBC_01220]
MSALLRHNGRPVPYIAARSLELVELPRLLGTRRGLDMQGHRRDADGWLWKPMLDTPGAGEPKLGTVNGPRQKRAMERLLCQVCGNPVVRNALGYPWLLEDHRGERKWPERELTTHPPVCPPCQPISANHCDHLRAGVVSVRVGRVLTDGVYGQLYTPTRIPEPFGKKTILFADDAPRRWMLGGQVAATLLDVTIVDMRTQTPVSREAVRR